MQRHRREHAAAADGAHEGEADGAYEGEADGEGTLERDEVSGRRHARRRRSSDPSSDRPVVARRRRGGEVDSDSEVEDLPDRFDSQGRPLDGRSATHSRWTARGGTFARPPRRAGGWDMQGAWQVSGTEQEAVERLVRSVTGALEGRRSWMGVIGDVLAGGLFPQGGGGDGDDGHEGGDVAHGRARGRTRP